MNRAKFNLYLAISWIFSLAVAYGVGWWGGVKSVAGLARTTVHSGFSFVLVLLVLVAAFSAIAAFRARGFISRDHQEHPML
jgi:hypothetical protein